MLKNYLSIAFFSIAFALGGASASFAQTSSAMPKPVQDQIVKIAVSADAGDSCVITSLFPAYYGPLSGLKGKLAVGLLDQDSENCGGMAPPRTSVVAYMVSSSSYRPVALPARLSTMDVRKILAVDPAEDRFMITVLFHAPGDPMCCGTRRASFSVKVAG